MPAQKKLVLRKEHFGGILVDTAGPAIMFLDRNEYSLTREKLGNTGAPDRKVTFFDAEEMGLPLLEDAASSPLDVYFEVTKGCNGHCTHCYMGSRPQGEVGGEVSLSEIEGIVRQFSRLGGYYVRLTGGEPTTRQDFFDIVDLLNDEGLVAAINTNGLFEDTTLEGILSRGVKDIRVSLDGPEDVNDAIRGKRAYRRACRTLAGIASHNAASEDPADPTINVVLMKSNLAYVDAMIELAQSYHSKISFGLMRVSGRAKREEMLSPLEVVLATERVRDARRRLALPPGSVRINYDILCQEEAPRGFSPYPFDNSKCPIATTGFSLTAQARIVPCGYLTDVEEGRWLGEDARGRDLLDLWHHSAVLLEARRIRRPGCADCGHYVINCNGGCPAMAYVFTGNLDGTDPYCVREVAAAQRPVQRPK